MKNLSKFAVLAVGLALSASSAMAASITGAITIFGVGDVVNGSQTQITFTSNGTATGGSGTLALADGDIISMLSPLTGSSTGNLFSTVTGTPAISFILSSLTFTPEANGQVQVNGTGTLTETGYSNTAATFQLNTASVASQTSFTLDTGVAPTPEPSSLMLMGSGLLSGAGMLLRRRRSIA